MMVRTLSLLSVFSQRQARFQQAFLLRASSLETTAETFGGSARVAVLWSNWPFLLQSFATADFRQNHAIPAISYVDSEAGNTVAWGLGNEEVMKETEATENLTERSLPECDWLENLSEDPYFRGLQDKVPVVNCRTSKEDGISPVDCSLQIEQSPPGHQLAVTAL